MVVVCVCFDQIQMDAWLTNGWSFRHAFLSSPSRAIAIPDISCGWQTVTGCRANAGPIAGALQILEFRQNSYEISAGKNTQFTLKSRERET